MYVYITVLIPVLNCDELHLGVVSIYINEKLITHDLWSHMNSSLGLAEN